VVDEAVEGVVKRSSALREVGKSFRRTRVSSRWWGGGFSFAFVVGLEMEMDQASPFRKRVLAVETEVDEEAGAMSEWRVFELAEAIFWLDWRSSVCLLSSHCVSHCPFRKSGCATMDFNMSMFVFTPAICVSFKARCPLRTASFQDDAVTMTFAIRLSKSADTTVGRPLMRCVSTLIPLPEGNWKEVILPIDNDQSL